MRKPLSTGMKGKTRMVASPDIAPPFGCELQKLGRRAHLMNKPLIGIIGSAVLTFIGILLRLNARAMAWAGVSSWSGPASETSYGRQETAIGQIGLALMFAGILVFLVTYCYWLFDKKSEN